MAFLKYFQKPFLDSSQNSLWWIPINWATKSQPEFSQTTPKVWLNPQRNHTTIFLDEENYCLNCFEINDISQNITQSENKNTEMDWIIINIQYTGFYRVNYDLQNWQAIAAQLKENHEVIHKFNRAQAINDAFAFALTGVYIVNYLLIHDIF